MQTCLDKQVIHQSWAERQLKAYYPDDSGAPRTLKSPETHNRNPRGGMGSRDLQAQLDRTRSLDQFGVKTTTLLNPNVVSRQECRLDSTCSSLTPPCRESWYCTTVLQNRDCVTQRRCGQREDSCCRGCDLSPSPLSSVRPRSTPLSMNQWPGMTHEVTSFSTYQILWHRSRRTGECGHHGPHM